MTGPQDEVERFAVELPRRVFLAACDLVYRHGGRVYDPLVELLFGRAWQEWRAAAVDCLPEGPVLDLGCGTGAALQMLGERGRVAVGVELEWSMLARARKRSRRIVQADARSLPFSNETFAACLATFPAPYILDPLIQSEIARVLTPGGPLVVLAGGTPCTGLLGKRSRRRLGPKERGGARALTGNAFVDGGWHYHQSPGGVAAIWRARRPGG